MSFHEFDDSNQFPYNGVSPEAYSSAHDRVYNSLVNSDGDSFQHTFNEREVLELGLAWRTIILANGEPVPAKDGSASKKDFDFWSLESNFAAFAGEDDDGPHVQLTIWDQEFIDHIVTARIGCDNVQVIAEGTRADYCDGVIHKFDSSEGAGWFGGAVLQLNRSLLSVVEPPAIVQDTIPEDWGNS